MLGHLQLVSLKGRLPRARSGPLCPHSQAPPHSPSPPPGSLSLPPAPFWLGYACFSALVATTEGVQGLGADGP